MNCIVVPALMLRVGFAGVTAIEDRVPSPTITLVWSKTFVLGPVKM